MGWADIFYGTAASTKRMALWFLRHFRKKIKDRRISATYWMSEETTRLNCITVMSSDSTYQRAVWMRFIFLSYTSVRLSAYKSNLSISTISSSTWVTQSIYPSVFIPLFLPICRPCNFLSICFLLLYCIKSVKQFIQYTGPIPYTQHVSFHDSRNCSNKSSLYSFFLRFFYFFRSGVARFLYLTR